MENALVFDELQIDESTLAKFIAIMPKDTGVYAYLIGHIHNRALIWLPKEMYQSRFEAVYSKGFLDRPDGFSVSMKINLRETGLVIMTLSATDWQIETGVDLKPYEDIVPDYVNLRAGFPYIDKDFKKVVVDAMEECMTTLGHGDSLISVDRTYQDHPRAIPASRIVWMSSQLKSHLTLSLLNETALKAAQSTLPSQTG